MKLLGALAALGVAAGCVGAPDPAVVASLREEVHSLARQARINAPWSKADLDAIADEDSAAQANIDRISGTSPITTRAGK